MRLGPAFRYSVLPPSTRVNGARPTAAAAASSLLEPSTSVLSTAAALPPNAGKGPTAQAASLMPHPTTKKAAQQSQRPGQQERAAPPPSKHAVLPQGAVPTRRPLAVSLQAPIGPILPTGQGKDAPRASHLCALVPQKQSPHPTVQPCGDGMPTAMTGCEEVPEAELGLLCHQLADELRRQREALQLPLSLLQAHAASPWTGSCSMVPLPSPSTSTVRAPTVHRASSVCSSLLRHAIDGMHIASSAASVDGGDGGGPGPWTVPATGTAATASPAVASRSASSAGVAAVRLPLVASLGGALPSPLCWLPSPSVGWGTPTPPPSASVRRPGRKCPRGGDSPRPNAFPCMRTALLQPFLDACRGPPQRDRRAHTIHQQQQQPREDVPQPPAHATTPRRDAAMPVTDVLPSIVRWCHGSVGTTATGLAPVRCAHAAVGAALVEARAALRDAAAASGVPLAGSSSMPSFVAGHAFHWKGGCSHASAATRPPAAHLHLPVPVPKGRQCTRSTEGAGAIHHEAGPAVVGGASASGSGSRPLVAPASAVVVPAVTGRITHTAPPQHAYVVGRPAATTSDTFDFYRHHNDPYSARDEPADRPCVQRGVCGPGGSAASSTYYQRPWQQQQQQQEQHQARLVLRGVPHSTTSTTTTANPIGPRGGASGDGGWTADFDWFGAWS